MTWKKPIFREINFIPFSTIIGICMSARKNALAGLITNTSFSTRKIEDVTTLRKVRRKERDYV